MKGLALIALLGVGIAAIWKHHALGIAKATPTSDLPSGVSLYPSIPAPNLPQQLTAAQVTNSQAVSEPGFSGAFGPNENQPGADEVLY